MIRASTANPWELGKEMGIELRTVRDMPFETATTADLALVAWHPDEQIFEARAWAGLARCILTKLGKSWSEADSTAFAERLRLGPLMPGGRA